MDGHTSQHLPRSLKISPLAALTVNVKESSSLGAIMLPYGKTKDQVNVFLVQDLYKQVDTVTSGCFNLMTKSSEHSYSQSTPCITYFKNNNKTIIIVF